MNLLEFWEKLYVGMFLLIVMAPFIKFIIEQL